jgi:hypothetical protein
MLINNLLNLLTLHLNVNNWVDPLLHCFSDLPRPSAFRMSPMLQINLRTLTTA